MSDSDFLRPIESRPNNLSPRDKEDWQTKNASVEDLTPEFRKWLLDFILVEVVPLIPAKQISGGTTTYAPYDSSFVTVAAESGLASERSLAAGTGIALVDGGAGSTLTISATSAASASSAEAYVTIGNTGNLSAERALTAGAGILITDGGANSTVTVSAVREVSLLLVVGDEMTALSTGTAKLTFRMPFAMTLTAVRASLTTASSSGDPTFDINESGVSILSTKLSIDANEKTSTTAATPAVISDSSLADDAEITIDIDAAGTLAAGLKIYLIGTRT